MSTTDQPSPSTTGTGAARTPGVHGRRPTSRINLIKHRVDLTKHNQTPTTGDVEHEHDENRPPVRDGYVPPGGVIDLDPVEVIDLDDDTDQDAAGGEGGGAPTSTPAGRLVVNPAATIARRVRVARTVHTITTAGKAVSTTTATGARATWVATRTVVTHPVTKAGAKLTARNLVVYPVVGAGVAWKAWHDTHGNRRYERMMNRAEAAGNHDALLEWESRDVAEKQRRHDRTMDWVRSPIDLLKAVGFGLLGFTGLLVLLGVILAFGTKDIAQVIAPIVGVINAITFLVWFLLTYGATMLILATAGVAVWLWHLGRTATTNIPMWLAPQTAREDAATALVTADGIVTALRHLPIPKLKEAFKKEEWVPRFELTPIREGQGSFRGFRAIFDLPLGVTPEMIADSREVLARNLHRNAIEVWISDYGKEKGGKAGYVNLYVADSGVMDKPTPEYPLLHTGTTDTFVGVPEGINQRGDGMLMPVVGSNAVFGGQPGQGKSNAVRVAVAGIALDPLAEIRMHVFALNGDFDAYAPRLSRYQKGVDVGHIESARDHLQELYEEVARREGRLAELGAKKLTRAIAEAHPDMRPLVIGFSECHELFSHGEFGKLAGELAIAVVKRGRKTGVSLIFDTQSSRADAIPSQLVENVGFNGCFKVKTWRSNDGFLGDGSFAAGIRATELRFNVDRGTMVATGVSEELFEIVRTFFIAVDDDAGTDQATDIIERAMAQLHPATPATGNTQTPGAPAPVTEVRDLLDDLDQVLPTGGGPEGRMPAGDVLGALRNEYPHWRPYADQTVASFVAAVTELGIKVPRTGNRNLIDPTTVRDIKARRDAALDHADTDLDDLDEDE